MAETGGAAGVVVGGAAGFGAGAAGATGADLTGGRTGAEGAGIGVSVLWNEPIGGGALEMGAATIGAGAGISDPGNGGVVELGGAAIWPISGTTLDVEADSEDGTFTGLVLRAAGFFDVSSLPARPICTTASTHSVPQANAEERSRSGVRMVEGGVTGC